MVGEEGLGWVGGRGRASLLLPIAVILFQKGGGKPRPYIMAE